ncbi:MAG: PA2778 family cysteine peptidase [Gammaproteobacteria bacterium]
MKRNFRRLPAIVAIALAVTGCGGSRALLDDATKGGALPGAVELTATPFFPQDDYQCGPAALATVLSDSGVAVTPDELVARVYIPGRRGSLQVELLAAARSAGRLAYVLDPELGAILAELDAGRPVLVLQNLGFGVAPVWHYAVVVGYDAAAGTLALRSGRTSRKVVTATRFRRTWDDGDHWAIVVLPPGELPVTPDRARYLEAAVALETAGPPGAAIAAFAAAVERWPDSAAARFGLANAHYASGDLQAAGDTYRRALDFHPDEPALLNNLAQVLLELEQCDDARATIDRAVAHGAAQPSLQDAIADTRAEIHRRCADDEASAR